MDSGDLPAGHGELRVRAAARRPDRAQRLPAARSRDGLPAGAAWQRWWEPRSTPARSSPAIWACRPDPWSGHSAIWSATPKPRPAREEERLLQAGGRLVTILDPDYPASLLDLSLPPPVLEVIGERWEAARARAGGRGRRLAADGRLRPGGATLFARDLRGGRSGRRLGLRARRRRGGPSRRARGRAAGPSPSSAAASTSTTRPDSAELAAANRGGGARLSEFPLGTGPWRANFPVRNRIIAALARATLVVQAAPRSGSLVTARLALELGPRRLRRARPDLRRARHGHQ